MTAGRFFPRRLPAAASLHLVALLALMALVALMAGAAGARAAEPAGPLRVLFIGNSLTYVNDLPGTVAALAEAAGETPPICRSVVEGGFSLEDHWNRKEALRAIEESRWDFVVLQQGPSASEEGRTLLLRDARRFAPAIRRAGATPALYMVWPSTSRSQDFPGVSDSYRRAARDVGGLLLPAGDAWRIVQRRSPALALYSADGLHPTVAGTYAAAAVIYARLYGRSPLGLPARWTPRAGEAGSIAPSDAKILQEAAAEAVGAGGG